MADWYEVPSGRWAANALRLMPKDAVWHTSDGARPTAVLMAGNRTVALVRKAQPKVWLTTMSGFEWRLTDDMQASRIVGSVLKFVNVKGFETRAKAMREIDRLIKEFPVA